MADQRPRTRRRQRENEKKKSLVVVCVAGAAKHHENGQQEGGGGAAGGQEGRADPNEGRSGLPPMYGRRSKNHFVARAVLRGLPALQSWYPGGLQRAKSRPLKRVDRNPFLIAVKIAFLG